MRVYIVNEFGTPIRGARVTITMWPKLGGNDRTHATDAEGNVRIDSMPDGEMEVSIYKNGYMDVRWIKVVANGEEHELVLPRLATITGFVIDAETRQPVPRFEVKRGNDHARGILYLPSQNTIQGHDGGFSFKVDRPGIVDFTVESEDHLPTTVSLGTNGVTHFDIELKRSAGPKGVVHTPDGQPAAGAQLAVLGPSGSVVMGARGFENFSNDPKRIAETDARGGFSLRAYPDGEKIIVVHPRGYADVPFTNFVRGSTIKLQAWGIIEGVLKVGQQPGANQSLLLTAGADSWALGLAYNSKEYLATTDAEGKFVFSNAPPGERRVRRQIQNVTSHPRVDLVVKPGEVTRITIGGDGHLLIGQLTAGDPNLTVNRSNSVGQLYSLSRQPPLFRTAEESRAWRKSSESIEARKQARSYAVQMTDTGTFRIEDVAPGTYDLAFRLRVPNNASFTTNIVVPEFISGPNLPPIDLGQLEIKVQPVNQGGPTGTSSGKSAGRIRIQ